MQVQHEIAVIGVGTELTLPAHIKHTESMRQTLKPLHLKESNTNHRFHKEQIKEKEEIQGTRLTEIISENLQLHHLILILYYIA